MCDRLEVWTSYAASQTVCGNHCTSQPSYRANYFFWKEGNCMCVENSATITPVCEEDTNTDFGYYTKNYIGTMTVECSDIFLTKCGGIGECEVKNGVCVYKPLVQTPDPAPAPAPDSALDSSPDCGLGAGERVCPEQLNDEGFEDGSIHTKLSGSPQVKKWYKVTQAQATIAPSGGSAHEKPPQGHWGVKLQYCGGDGTGGPYDATNCTTDGVDFYTGGCATQVGDVPQNIAGECPMIYSLDTARQKETDADSFVESAGSACDNMDPGQCCSTNGCALDGSICYKISNHQNRLDSCGVGGVGGVGGVSGGCDDYNNNAAVNSQQDANEKKQGCTNDPSCTWTEFYGGPFMSHGVSGDCRGDGNNGPSPNGPCDSRTNPTDCSDETNGICYWHEAVGSTPAHCSSEAA